MEKNVLIFGLGQKGGISSAIYFAKQGYKIKITDLKKKEDLPLNRLLKFKNISYRLGKHSFNDFLKADLIIKNPAISWNNFLIKKATKAGKKISSQVIIFFENCPAKIIGVSGTKGKSTTANMICELLKKKYKCWLVGNIGKPFLKFLPKIKKEDIVVAELSSFQLEDLAKIKKSPSISIFTNFFADHQDRYKNLNNYFRAKSALFRFQKNNNLFIYPQKDLLLSNFLKKYKIKAKKIGLPIDGSENENLAIWLAHHLGIKKSQIKEVLKNFQPPSGRREIVAKIKKRTFINDTCATNPQSSLFLLKKIKKPFILITGGLDKNLNYKNFIKFLNKSKKVRKTIFLSGSATEKIKKELKKNFKETNSMEKAVKMAFSFSKPNDFIILSPAAASLNLFKNEFDRGDQFKKSIKKLNKKVNNLKNRL